MTSIPYQLVDVPDGWTGWIRGRVVGEAELLAPLSKRPCVYYHLLAKNEDDLAAAGQLASLAPIAIDDGTARAVVEPTGAFVHVAYDVTSTVRSGELLARLGVEGPYLLREGILERGQILTIHGRCLRDVDRDPRRVAHYRSGPPVLVRVAGAPEVRLWITEVD